MADKKDQTGQTELLGAFDKLSLSTSSTDNNNLTTDAQNELEKNSGSSIQSCSSISPSNSDGQQVKTLEIERKVSPWSQIRLYNINLKHPFPKEPIISTKTFADFALNKSFSLQTDFSRSKRVGYFSCHIDRNGKTQLYRPDKSSLRYLRYKHGCQVNLNLLEGYNPEKVWGRVPPGEMHLLRWYIQNYSDSTGTEYDRDSDIDSNDDDECDDVNNNYNIDFICYTRVLRSFIWSPYIANEDWMCIAIKVRGTIILDELDTPERMVSMHSQNEKQRQSSYAGYKFEEMITRRFDSSLRPTYNEGNRDSFYIVSKARLNNHSLLYCTRADCATNKAQLHKSINEMEFAQIKTRRKMLMQSHKSRCWFWKTKASRWWIEYVLANIGNIIVGDKDEDFMVNKIIRIRPDSIPREENEWSPRTCFSFTDKLLSFIKENVTEELTPYRFYCHPLHEITCQRLNEPAAFYLPQWFIDNEQPKN